MHWRAEKLGRDRKKFARGWADDRKPRGSAQHWPGATNQGPKPRKLTSPATLSAGVPRELARAAALAPFVEVLARFAARAVGGGMRAVLPSKALSKLPKAFLALFAKGPQRWAWCAARFCVARAGFRVDFGAFAALSRLSRPQAGDVVSEQACSGINPQLWPLGWPVPSLAAKLAPRGLLELWRRSGRRC